MGYFLNVVVEDREAATGFSRKQLRDVCFINQDVAAAEAEKTFNETEGVILVELFEEGVRRPILIWEG